MQGKQHKLLSRLFFLKDHFTAITWLIDWCYFGFD